MQRATETYYPRKAMHYGIAAISSFANNIEICKLIHMGK